MFCSSYTRTHGAHVTSTAELFSVINTARLLSGQTRTQFHAVQGNTVSVTLSPSSGNSMVSKIYKLGSQASIIFCFKDIRTYMRHSCYKFKFARVKPTHGLNRSLISAGVASRAECWKIFFSAHLPTHIPGVGLGGFALKLKFSPR